MYYDPSDMCGGTCEVTQTDEMRLLAYPKRPGEGGRALTLFGADIRRDV